MNEYTDKSVAQKWVDISRQERRRLDIIGSRKTLGGIISALAMLSPHQKLDRGKWIYSGFGWQIVIHLRS